MAKETSEFLDFGTAIAAGVAKAVEDGKVNGEDLQHVVGPLIKAGPGLQGFGKIGAELAVASIDDKVDLRVVTGQNLAALNEDDAFDIQEGIHGFIGIFSIVARKNYTAGVVAGRAGVLEELRAAGVISDVQFAQFDLQAQAEQA